MPAWGRQGENARLKGEERDNLLPSQMPGTHGHINSFSSITLLEVLPQPKALSGFTAEPQPNIYIPLFLAKL